MLFGVLSIRRVPASLALLRGLFAVCSAVLQREVYAGVRRGDHGNAVAGRKGDLPGDGQRVHDNSGIGDIDRLLSRGGMDSMLLTIWLIIGAVTFGALLEQFGLIDRLINPLIAGQEHRAAVPDGLRLRVRPQRRRRRSVHRAGAAESDVPRGVRVTRAGPAEPVPPRRRQRHRDVRAGAVELVRGVHGRGAGVSTLLLLPFAVFNFVSPALSVLFGVTGFKFERPTPEPIQEYEERTETEHAPANEGEGQSPDADRDGGRRMVGAGVFSSPRFASRPASSARSSPGRSPAPAC